MLDQHDLVALIAKHIANELPDRAVVVDDQDVTYPRTLAGLSRDRNFDGRRSSVEATSPRTRSSTSEL